MADVVPLECLICFENLDQIDYDLELCGCSFQICKFCFDKLAIEAEDDAHCPGCRRPYDVGRITGRLNKSWIGLKRILGNSSSGRQAFLLAQILSFFKPDSPVPRELFSHKESLVVMDTAGRDKVMSMGLMLLEIHGIITPNGKEDFRVKPQFYCQVRNTCNLEEVFKKCCDLFCIHLKRPGASPEFKGKLMEHAPPLMDAMLSWSNDELLMDELTEFVHLICDHM